MTTKTGQSYDNVLYEANQSKYSGIKNILFAA